jgi:ADP-ribose pyrophosphatase YjhB (NUDIX family)
MKFCTECGRAIQRRWMAQEGRERYFCEACGITHYQNPRVIVSAVVSWQDRILMCRRADEPARGLWTVPSGFLECGETLEEGAAREIGEETGVAVDPQSLELYSVMTIAAIEQVVITFRLALTALPAIRCGSECMDVTFMAQHDLPAEGWAWREMMIDRPRKLFDDVRSNRYDIQLTSVCSVPSAGVRSRVYAIRPMTMVDDA